MAFSFKNEGPAARLKTLHQALAGNEVVMDRLRLTS
jgi:hypothetical protein